MESNREMKDLLGSVLYWLLMVMRWDNELEFMAEPTDGTTKEQRLREKREYLKRVTGKNQLL